MKQFLFAVLFAVVSSHAAGETFYQKNNSMWTVYGVDQQELNPACFAVTKWDDGSDFRLIFDLADGELYMLIVNNQWNIIDPPGNYNLRLNLFINNNVLGDNLTFELLNKNTIRIRAMPIKFIDMFAQANKMQIVMPGSISNVIVNLSKSSQAVDFMTQCVDTYKSTKKRVTTPSKRLDL